MVGSLARVPPLRTTLPLPVAEPLAPLVEVAPLAATRMPPLMIVPPVYVFEPERTEAPPPARVTLVPGLASLIGPEMVKLLPVVAPDADVALQHERHGDGVGCCRCC